MGTTKKNFIVKKILTISLVIASVLFLACERAEEDVKSIHSFDTLPDSEWWEGDSVNNSPLVVNYLKLNISWDEGKFRTYTDLPQFPNNELFNFHVGGDTIYLDEYNGIPMWYIESRTDTTMKFRLLGIVPSDGYTYSIIHFYLNR